MTTDDPAFMRVTPDGMRRLLAIAAAIDGRTWADDDGFRATARSWHETIRRELEQRRRFPLDCRLAEDAVYAWYGCRPPGRHRIMPDDICDQAAALRRDRLARTGIPDPPEDLDTSDDAAVSEAMAAAREAIAAGGTRADAAAAMAEVARRHPLRIKP